MAGFQASTEGHRYRSGSSSAGPQLERSIRPLRV